MRGTEAGTCEADGFCSFEDPTCPSGRRYGGHSGSVGSSCVPLTPGETTGDSSSNGSRGSSSEGGSVTTTFDPSTTAGASSSGIDGLTSGAETGGTAGQGTTLATTMDTESTAAGSSSETGASTTTGTTTGPGPSCGSPFLDEFEDATLPGWQTTNDAGSVGVVAGELQFDVDGGSTAYSNVFGGPFDVQAQEGFVQMTVSDAPSDPSVDLTLMFRESLDPSESHSFRLRGPNRVRAWSSSGGSTEIEVPDYDSIAVRMRWDEGMVLHEYALDGGTWMLLLEETPAFSPFAGYISMLGGTYNGATDSVAVESLEGCFLVL